MSKTFTVTIRATITKDITVEADNRGEAINKANELFDPEDTEAAYKQEAVFVS